MKPALSLPCLVLVTDRRLCPAGDLAEHVRDAVEGGAGLIELREKDLPSDELLSIARSLRQVTAGRALLVVNGPPDVALACGADGVHLPEAGMATQEARAAVGEDLLVGRSVHSVEGARRAQKEGADYLILGTIFASLSKPGVRPAGVGLVKAVAGQVSIPVLGIGGVNAQNAGQVIAAGAQGVAVISSILAAHSPRQAAGELMQELRAAWRARGSALRLTVNGKPREYGGPPALPAFLQALQVDQRHVAVARNGDVLRREEYEQVVLQDGDVLEIVHMVGGGAPGAAGFPPARE